ncbi:DoxX family protein [bacterium]|nr:MAG: DoxX family protein [bacterium]|tara:strand:- start:4133 stop:4501 length:369 start_codon:yes stop_codon:yes gene_type:complete
MRFAIEIGSIIIMCIFYIGVGVKHFTNPMWFVKIVPPFLPYKLSLVYISGFFEILFGIMLLFPITRYIAAWGLILLLIAVFPANIYLAMTNGAALNTTPLIAWGRLPFQFLFIAIAYWHSTV